MPTYGSLTTTKTIAQTKRDIEEIFRKWDVDEYRILANEKASSATVRFWIKDKEQVLICNRFYYGAQNLRALWGILEALRLAAERGILEDLARAAMAMLPAGKQKRPAHEVLGVMPNAPLEVAEAAYRTLAKKVHPDAPGGDAEAFRELTEALEEMKKR